MQISKKESVYILRCDAKEINDLHGCLKGKINVLDTIMVEAATSKQFTELQEQRRRLIHLRDDVFDAIKPIDLISNS